MSDKIIGESVDCADAAALARFWGAVLGRRVAGGATPEEAVLLADDGATSGPRLAFHQVPEAKVVKNRLHLDLITETWRPIHCACSASGPAVTGADPGQVNS